MKKILLLIVLSIFFTVFHSCAGQLTPETTALLDRALSEDPDTGIENSYDTMRRISEQPDWQAALDYLLVQIRNNPDGDNNSRCLTIEHILRAHKDMARIDLSPLLPVLKTKNPFNQQKAAQVIEAVMSRKNIVTQIERDLIKALIPLMTSQRDRVVIPVLKVLEYITGQKTIGRNPDKWCSYYYDRFHEKIDLSNAVYELLIIVNLPEDGKPGYIYNGQLITDLKFFDKAVLEVKSIAEKKSLQISFIVITDQNLLDSNDKMLKQLERIKPLEPIMKAAGINSVTFAPLTEKYHPVWKQ